MKAIGGILIVAGILLGFFGFQKVSQSSESVNVLGLEVSASDESAKTQGYLMLGAGIVLLGGGLYTLNKKR